MHLVSHCSAADELFLSPNSSPVAAALTTGGNLSQFFLPEVSVCIQIWQDFLSCNLQSNTCVYRQHTSMFHTQEEWYNAEYTLPTFFGSLTSHTYRLWSLYTQESHWLVGSKVKAIVSGYFASAIPEKRRLHKERTTARLICALLQSEQGGEA